MKRTMWGLLCGCLVLVSCSGGSDKPAPDSASGSEVVGDSRAGDDGVQPVCVAGETRCFDPQVVEVCNAAGLEWEPLDPCPSALCTLGACDGGQCVELPSAHCDDDDPCTDDLCLAYSGGCMHTLVLGRWECCSTNEDCDKGAQCGEAICDLATGACTAEAVGPCTKTLHSFGEKGSEPGQLKNPKGLDVLDDGSGVVADSGNDRVVVFSAEGTLVAMIEEAFERKLKAPACIHQSADGHLLVCDTGNDRVVLFSAQLEPLAEWPPAGYPGVLFYSPLDVATDASGNVYVADGAGSGFDEGNRLLKMNMDGKVVLEPQGKTGEGAGNFNIPAGLEIAPDGQLVVADTGNDRIQLFTAELEPVFQWGDKGGDLGQFDGPSDLTIGTDGTLWIVDAGNQRVQGVETCLPDCTGRTCGDDGCGGSCTSPFIVQLQEGFDIEECPAFGECDVEAGECVGWVGEGGKGCEPEGAAGCQDCDCQACVCEGVDPLDPSLYYDGADSDPFCCDTEWDGVCQFECMYVCGHSCPLPEVEEVQPTLQASFQFDDVPGGKLTAPVKIASDANGFLYVLDTVKSSITVYGVLGK